MLLATVVLSQAARGMAFSVRRSCPRSATAGPVGRGGMCGRITLAAAFALPADFPQHETVVLVAFAVVRATFVAQGLTLARSSGGSISLGSAHSDRNERRAEARWRGRR